jgi:hypothetical protein
MILNSPTISGSLTVTGNIIASGSITLSGSVASASYALSASNAQTASFANSFTVAGNLTAQTLVVQTITSSVDFVTGSTRFGSIAANTHQFTGSMSVSGSITSQRGYIATGYTQGSTGQNLEIGYVSASNLYAINALNRTNGLYDKPFYIDAQTLILNNGSGGNIGIGTSSPSESLHIVGNLFIDDNDTTGKGIMLESADRPLITRGWDAFTSGNKNGIGRWGVYMESAELLIGSPGTDYSGGTVTIGGWLVDGTKQSNLTVNNETRRVGIGTTSPTNKLHIVNNGNSVAAVRIADTNANGSFLVLNASNTDAGILANGTSAIPMDFYTGGEVRMRISSTGLVTKPSQTYFYARGAVGGQDFSAGAGTILYPNVDYNIGSAYNGSTSTFTAPVAGVYVFSCQMFNRPNTPLWVYWTINGTGSVSCETQNTTSNFVNFYSTVTRYLNAGDTMRLVITGSGSYQVHVNGSTGPGSFFCGYLLG